MKLGRPPKPKADKREKPLRILLSKSERQAVDDYAKDKMLDTSTWARAAILEIVGYKN
jgi:hypothetical protein